MTTTPTYRGTTNANARGNTKDRAARRAWLLATYAADCSLTLTRTSYAGWEVWHSALAVEGLLAYESVEHAELIPSTRCYRCGALLHDTVTLPDGEKIPATLTVDRIIPGILGGTYRRNNIRPACSRDNSETGGHLGNARKKSR